MRNVSRLVPRNAPAVQICRKPSFLFLGPGRAGSNWFTEILREHPDVFVPKNKGTFFFSKHYHMGTAWYERFFAPAGEAVAGEVCEDYLLELETLVRIREYAPEMRLICCLRNPYERAISSWRFFARNGRGEPTLAAQAERNPDVFECGLYATQLQNVQSLFRRDRILVFLFEEIASDPRSVARRLYRFIGVNPEFVPTSLHRRINGNGQARFPLLARLVHDIHMRSWGTSRLASNLTGQIKRIRPLRGLLRRVLYHEGVHASDWRDLIAEFPDEIVARYQQEITALEQILGRDLSSWRALPAADSALRSSAGNCRP